MPLKSLPGFVGPSYRAVNVVADAQMTDNLFPERIESGTAQVPAILLPTPGLVAFSTNAGYAKVRAIYSEPQSGRCFAILDDKFGEVSAAGAFTIINKVQNDGNVPSMCSNGRGGNQLFIVSGGLGYIYNLSTGAFAQITDADFPQNVSRGIYFDQYFIALVGGTSQFNLSNLSNGLSWNGTDVSLNRVQGVDNFVSAIGDHREVWMFGARTTEVYYNSGNTFPFSNIPGIFIEIGCLAPDSVTKLDNTHFWIGQSERGSGSAFMAANYNAQRISTHGVEAVWDTYPTLADAIGWSYEQEGHAFYVLYFPSADATWVFDANTKAWHERSWLNPADGARHAFRGRAHAFAFNKHLVGDTQSGNIYQMTPTAFNDFGGAVRRVRRLPNISANGIPINYHRVRLVLESGVALQSGQGSAPQVMLRYSDDGGHTWGEEIRASTGKVGQYDNAWRFVCDWFMLGSSAQRVFEVSVSDPIAWRFIDLLADTTMGLA